MKYDYILFSIAFIIAGYLIIRFLLYHFVDVILYLPAKTNVYNSYNLDETVIRTLDGQDDIYILQKKNNNSKKHIIYSHGNAANMNSNLHIILKLSKYCSVTMYDYRGYGKSTGKSNEETLKNDILTVYKYVTKVDQVAPENIILYGRSLGVFPTLFLANTLNKINVNVNHIIIESGFSSINGLLEKVISKSITKILLPDRYKNTNLIQDITQPILLAHSPNDEIVLYNNKEELHKHNMGIEHFELNKLHNDDTLTGNYLKRFIDIIQQ